MTQDTISFTASATLAQGVGAHADLVVDGQTIGSVTVGTATETYSFNTTLTPNEAHDIQVIYDNDTVINGQDRNLTLNSVSVDGQTFAATSSYEIYQAPGQGNFASDGAMNWNGTAEFTLPASLFATQSGSSGSTTSGSSSSIPPPPPSTGSGPDTISFTASATLAQGVGAHVDVVVDGQTIGSVTVGTTTETYSFNTTLAPNAAHDVQIVYDNDAVINGQDRNLTLNSIAVDGQTFAANSSYEVYHAQGQGDLASDGAMNWNGTAEFSLPASLFTTQSGSAGSTSSGLSSSSPPPPPTGTGTGSDTITFTASATLAAGVGAHVDVVVDGQTIGSTTVGTATSTYSFNTTLAPNAAHDVQIVYDNDTVINGQDRNLTLNSISVDGQTFAANSGYEVYHAPSQGNFASDGAMNWNGTAEFSLPASLFTTQSGSSGSTSSGSSASSTPPPPTSTGSGGGMPTATGFYVSTSGSDNGDGSAAHPFATLAKAVSAMEASGTHTTYIEGGTYNLTSTVTLGNADSGMTIESAPGSQAVLDGGGSLTTLIQLNGATGVTLQGLTFQNTGGSGAAVMVGAVTLNGASQNSIVDNYFANTGEGLLLESGSSNNTVSGNELDNSATSAIEVKDGSNGNSFDSNVINGTGAIGTQGGGFFLHGVDNNSITHNLVENTAGIGIGIENWDSTTINVGNSVVGNILENTNTSPQSTDSGAIYELGRSDVNTQSVISDNYISGPTQPASAGSHIIGIYLDDNTSGVQVTNNIVSDIISNGLEIHGGNNITVQNNIFDLGASSGSAVLFQNNAATAGGPTMANDAVTQNIIASTSTSPTAFSNIDGGSPTINDNFYMDLLNSNFQMGGFSQTNAQYGNAELTNEAAGNYALTANAGANSIGFISITQSTMGPHPVTAHWYAS